jgi:hypothetical protein
MEEKIMRIETLKKVIIIEFTSDLKKFIFLSASWKFSHVIVTGQPSGLATISNLGLIELIKTNKKGATYESERNRPTPKITFLPVERRLLAIFIIQPPCA